MKTKSTYLYIQRSVVLYETMDSGEMIIIYMSVIKYKLKLLVKIYFGFPNEQMS